MFLEIVSPEATLFAGEVSSVTVPGVNGEFQMLQDHAPILSLLQQGFVKFQGKIVLSEDFEARFSKDTAGNTLLPINSGTVEMKDNKIIILAD